MRAGRTARMLFWAAAAFAFVTAVLSHPPEVPGHPIAFATLALLGSLAYPHTALMKLLIRLSLFGAFTEVVQAIRALHRDCDLFDWLADTIAAAAVLSGAPGTRLSVAPGGSSPYLPGQMHKGNA